MNCGPHDVPRDEIATFVRKELQAAEATYLHVTGSERREAWHRVRMLEAIAERFR